MLAQDWHKSHGMTTVFKDYGRNCLSNSYGGRLQEGTLLFEIPSKSKGKNFVWKIYCYFPQKTMEVFAEGNAFRLRKENVHKQYYP